MLAVAHRLGLIEAACCRCLNVLLNGVGVKCLHWAVSLIDEDGALTE
jgi:hypothetical protein